MARTFVCSEVSLGVAMKSLSNDFIKLAGAYDDAQRGVIEAVKPGWKVNEVTQFMADAIRKTKFGKCIVAGYIHGIGVGFEEGPHPSHYPQHGEIVLKPNMTVSVGHAVLAVPVVGDIEGRMSFVSESGCEALTAGRELPWTF